MIYMVIEHFKNRNVKEIYKRFEEKGRMMPEGLVYISSWIETNYDRCFQVMKCDDEKLLHEWASNWNDLMEFEFIPVIESKEMIEKMKNK
jgi:hypothetical protein